MNAVTLVKYEDWEIEIIYKWLAKASKEVRDKIANIICILLNPTELDIIKNTDFNIIKERINIMFDTMDNMKDIT